MNEYFIFYLSVLQLFTFFYILIHYNVFITRTVLAVIVWVVRFTYANGIHAFHHVISLQPFKKIYSRQLNVIKFVRVLAADRLYMCVLCLNQ